MADAVAGTPDPTVSLTPDPAVDAPNLLDGGAPKDDSQVSRDTTVQTPEQKAAAEKEAADKKAADDKAKAGAPEKYEDFKLPEGMELDKEALAEFLPLAKDLGLTQEQAQKLIDSYAKQAQKVTEEPGKRFAKLQEDWTKATTGDKEYGGKDFDANLATANAAIKEFGSPELNKVLAWSGLGNHPELVRTFWKIGKAMKEDGVRSGASSDSKPKDVASLLYPNQK